MDHKASDDQEFSSFGGDQHQAGERAVEPVRSRWTPKPEQILILESIFNSGMVNPAKDDTVRIRKLLEKFGAVGDANVFYWFQNRRSRSRRRQRQIQAAGLSSSTHHDQCYSCNSSSSSSSGTSPPPPLTTQLVPQLQAVVSDQPSAGVIISAIRPVLLPAGGDHQYLQYLHHDDLVRSPASGSTVHSSASSYNSNFASAGTHGRSSSSTSSNCEGQAAYSQLFHQHHEQAAGDLTNIFDQYAPAHVDSTTSLMWPCDDATLRYHSGEWRLRLSLPHLLPFSSSVDISVLALNFIIINHHHHSYNSIIFVFIHQY